MAEKDLPEWLLNCCTTLDINDEGDRVEALYLAAAVSCTKHCAENNTLKEKASDTASELPSAPVFGDNAKEVVSTGQLHPVTIE